MAPETVLGGSGSVHGSYYGPTGLTPDPRGSCALQVSQDRSALWGLSEHKRLFQ